MLTPDRPQGPEFDSFESLIEDIILRHLGAVCFGTLIIGDGDEQVKWDAYERKMFDATKSLGDYCVKEHIDDLVLIDRSARPVWNSLWQYLDLAHPEANKPSVHFLSPAVLDNSDLSTPLYRGIANKLGRRKAKKQLSSSNNSLLNSKDSSVLIFDICTHTGQTIQSVQGLLASIGFSNIKTGVYMSTLDEHGVNAAITPDFVFETDDQDTLGCEPYGNDPGLYNVRSSIYTSSSHEWAASMNRAEERATDRDIIRRQFELSRQ